MSDEQVITTDEAVEASADASGSEETSIYELAYHLVPTISEEDRASHVLKLRQAIEKAGGTIINDIAPEHMELAYTMTKQIAGKLQKYASAYFGWLYFELSADKTALIKETCDKDDTVLRYLILKTTKELAQSQNRPSLKAAPEIVTSSEPVEPKPEATDVGEEIASEEEVDKAIDELVEEPAKV